MFIYFDCPASAADSIYLPAFEGVQVMVRAEAGSCFPRAGAGAVFVCTCLLESSQPSLDS